MALPLLILGQNLKIRNPYFLFSGKKIISHHFTFTPSVMSSFFATNWQIFVEDASSPHR
jgi:hypothetical protein